MILRYDRLGIEIPAGDHDPAGANAVQELMGGRFGEMSTLMNYTFQSFSFRGRTELRPFYDLIANIAAEEYGHIEAVGATITSMLTGAVASEIVANGNPAHFLKAGKGVLPVDSGASPWTGDYVFSSGDLVENGMTLCGGGVLLRGLPELIQQETGLPVRVAEDPACSIPVARDG